MSLAEAILRPVVRLRSLGSELPFSLVVGLLLLFAVGVTVISERVLHLPGTDYVSPVLGAGVLALGFLIRPHAALVAFALLQLFIDIIGINLGETVRNVDEIVVPVFVLLAFLMYKPWRTGRFHVAREATVGVLVVAGLVSTLLAGVPARIWVIALLLLLKGIMFFYLVSWMPFGTQDLRRIVRVFAGVAVIVFAFGLIEMLNPRAFQDFFSLRDVGGGERGTAIRSLVSHPGLYGWFMMFAALYGYAAFMIERKWRYLVAALVLSFGTFASGRRKPLVGLPVALVVGFVWHLRTFGIDRRQLLRVWAPIAIGTLVLAIAFAPVLVRLVELTVERELAGGEATTARAALYMGSVEIGRDYFPLGGGLGRYGSWMARVEYSPLYYEYGLYTVNGLRPEAPRWSTDTFWPMILGELGVIGLIALASFFGLIVLMLWRQARQRDHPLIMAICLGTLFVFIEALVESIATSPLTGPRQYPIVMGAAGIVAAIAYQRGRRPAASEPAEHEAEAGSSSSGAVEATEQPDPRATGL